MGVGDTPTSHTTFSSKRRSGQTGWRLNPTHGRRQMDPEYRRQAGHDPYPAGRLLRLTTLPSCR